MALTVHDLLPLEASTFDAHRFRQSVDHAVRSRSPIITPSEFTASLLRKRFNASDGQVTVIPWAADSGIKYIAPGQMRSRLCAQYGVNEPFILHLGATDPRKNTQALIRAFAAVAPIVRNRWKLLVIGINDPAWMEELDAQLGSLGCRHRVLLHAYAPHEDLSGLFSAASILAYPSKAEGFGLPVLDAWATRTAVLTSHVTSLPEVAGDAALLVDPHDLCSIARGLGKLMAEFRLREQLVRKGTARLAGYSWQHTAELFVDLLERTVARREGLRLAA
jgi:glycosyltransferase involved in cell wall biosynthesis